jgi:hypothetical protein
MVILACVRGLFISPFLDLFSGNFNSFYEEIKAPGSTLRALRYSS